MNSVLLFDTAIGTSNVGDEIIFESVKDGLDDLLSKSVVLRLGTHTKNFSAAHIFRGIKNHGKIRNFCFNTDYKFICGTNMLDKKIPYIGGQFILSKASTLLYKNSILVGVGRISDFEINDMSHRTKNLYKKILSPKYYHSTRDDETKRIVEQLGFKAINTGCPTLWKLTPDFCNQIPKSKAENVIISLSGYPDQIDKQKDKLFYEIIRNNYKNVYVWIQTLFDYEYCQRIIGDANYIFSFKDFDDIMKKGNVDYVGTRLHGGIYALQHKIRTIILAIDERARGFNETNNIPIFERNDIENIEPILNNYLETDIKLNLDNINKFLNQF